MTCAFVDHGGFATCELREWYSSGRSWDEYLGTTSQKARESEEVPKQAPSERNKLLNHIGGGINANVEIPEHQPLVSIGGPVPAPGPKAFNPMVCRALHGAILVTLLLLADSRAMPHPRV